MTATPSFTVRDLNRQLARVLEACDRDGRVLIRRRNGKTYELRPAPAKVAAGTKRKKTVAEAWAEFFRKRDERIRKFGVKPMTAAQREQLSRMIAGE